MVAQKERLTSLRRTDPTGWFACVERDCGVPPIVEEPNGANTEGAGGFACALEEPKPDPWLCGPAWPRAPSEVRLLLTDLLPPG